MQGKPTNKQRQTIGPGRIGARVLTRRKKQRNSSEVYKRKKKKKKTKKKKQKKKKKEIITREWVLKCCRKAIMRKGSKKEV